MQLGISCLRADLGALWRIIFAALCRGSSATFWDCRCWMPRQGERQRLSSMNKAASLAGVRWPSLQDMNVRRLPCSCSSRSSSSWRDHGRPCSLNQRSSTARRAWPSLGRALVSRSRYTLRTSVLPLGKLGGWGVDKRSVSFICDNYHCRPCPMRLWRGTLHAGPLAAHPPCMRCEPLCRSGWMYVKQDCESIEQILGGALCALLCKLQADSSSGSPCTGQHREATPDSQTSSASLPAVVLSVAGRTDRGVSALGQVFSFYSWEPRATPQARKRSHAPPAGCARCCPMPCLAGQPMHTFLALPLMLCGSVECILCTSMPSRSWTALHLSPSRTRCS